ncbi:MAG: DUF4363 family protein [Acutalibacteraceae bacterium]
MLKRFCASALLLILCIFTCVSSSIVVTRTAEKIKETLSETAVYLKNGEPEKACEVFETCEERFDRDKTTFDVFLNHSDTDKLSHDIAEIRPLILSGNSEFALEKIEESISVLNEIIDEQKLSIGNVF